jgi:hypothetical protein
LVFPIQASATSNASTDESFATLDGRFKPELEQLAVDARRSPQWVFDAHLPTLRSRALDHVLQHHHLVSERSIFGFKPDLRLEWRDQDDQDKTYRRGPEASIGCRSYSYESLPA